MKVLMLAGGFGTRLAHMSDGKPKPLVDVAGKTMLERQLTYFLDHGFDDIRLSLHHKADQIISFCQNRWPGKFEFVVEPVPMGTGGGIKYAMADMREPFLVINVDTLSTIDLPALSRKPPNTITCTYLEDARDFGLLHINEGRVRAFLEKPKERISGYINAGWYLLRPDFASHVSKDSFMMETDVFPHLAKNNDLHAFIHQGYWTDVGTQERLEEARRVHANNNETARNT